MASDCVVAVVDPDGYCANATPHANKTRLDHFQRDKCRLRKTMEKMAVVMILS
jgi:hypothetical protein